MVGIDPDKRKLTDDTQDDQQHAHHQEEHAPNAENAHGYPEDKSQHDPYEDQPNDEQNDVDNLLAGYLSKGYSKECIHSRRLYRNVE